MELTPHSRNRLRATMQTWDVPRDFAEPMYNYLVHGYSPGGCFTSVLANDFYGAIRRSHPGNTIQAFKALSGWIHDTMPREAFGDYDAVKHWTQLDAAQRRKILEKRGLVYTEQEEVWKTLVNEPTVDPVLY